MHNWKRFLSLRYIIGKIREKGVKYSLKRTILIFLPLLNFVINRIKGFLQHVRYIKWLSHPKIDSVLAIYDFRANPYTFNFVEFLANSEVFRVKNSLSYIDLVFVVDREKMHRGDQPEVTSSNYRNWILNIAESTDVLRSVSSLSIFDNSNKFLDFYHNVRRTHMVFPNNGLIYQSKSKYYLKYVSDYYKSSGFVPKFQSSQVLLEWAERYILEKACPLIPIVVFVRNSSTHPKRNTLWSEWVDFFRDVIHKYPVKFFIVNDFWNPVDVPLDLNNRVIVSPEPTISTKYRCALTQKCSLVVATSIGSFAYNILTDTPYLLFNMDNEIFSSDRNKQAHGMTSDLQFPWSSKYQKTFPGRGALNYIREEFEKMYVQLDEDGKLVPSFYKS